jgi:hypothetical protein
MDATNIYSEKLDGALVKQRLTPTTKSNALEYCS